MKPRFYYIFPWLLGLCCIAAMCSKEDETGNSTPAQDNSIAGKIAGTFKGEGKSLPDNISLGTYRGCVTPPGWQNNFITGQATVTISKISDDKITVVLFGGPFSPTRSYTNVTVVANGSRIDLPFGYFDTNSRFLSVSINTANSIYTPSPSCLQGMPYYSGGSILNDGNYSYYTHGRIDFSGTKQ